MHLRNIVRPCLMNIQLLFYIEVIKIETKIHNTLYYGIYWLRVWGTYTFNQFYLYVGLSRFIGIYFIVRWISLIRSIKPLWKIIIQKSRDLLLFYLGSFSHQINKLYSIRIINTAYSVSLRITRQYVQRIDNPRLSKVTSSLFFFMHLSVGTNYSRKRKNQNIVTSSRDYRFILI